METKLGDYPVGSEEFLLSEVKNLSFAIMLLGLVFDVVILLLMAVSVLLIYSLLMITVEEKTFDSGIMRLVGLSKAGYATSILVQASCFVFPSIICAFAASIPVMYLLYQLLIDQQN